jgi:hypothetical protein
MEDVAVTSAAGRTIHAVLTPFMGDFARYQRSTDGGRTWGAKYRLRGITSYGALAATGDRVYLAFHADACGNGIGVARNERNGAPGAWSRVTCLTPAYSVANRPTAEPEIAASGSSVYVLTLDGRTDPGEAQLWTSRDGGRTFASQKGDGWLLEADRERVATSWPDEFGDLGIRVSRDGARTWGATIRVPPGAVTEVDLRDTQTLVQGLRGPTEISAPVPWYGLASDREFAPIVVPWPTTSEPDSGQPTTRLVLGPAGALGALGDASCDAVWRTSADGGSTWSLPEQIGDGCPMDDAYARSTGRKLPVFWADDGRIMVFIRNADGQYIAERP